MESKHYNETNKDYMSCTLKNFFYLKREEKRYNKELLELDQRIEEEKIYIRGMIADGSIAGNGCSVSSPKEQCIGYLENKSIELSNERDKIIDAYNILDNLHNITKNLKDISNESRIVINNVYERGLSIDYIANKLEKVSKQTIYNRIDKALEEMCKKCWKKF